MRALDYRPRHEAGWTMISLMVGLMVSLLVILSMLSLFRVVAANVMGSSSMAGMQPTAAQDRQIATALLSVQTLLQNAGYGYAPPAVHDNHFVLVKTAQKSVVTTPSATLQGSTLAGTSTVTISGTAQSIGSGTVSPPLDVTTAVNAMFWETAGAAIPATAATAQCYGLLSDASGTKALYLLQASGSCSPVGSNWNTVTWTVTPLVAGGLLNNPVTFNAQETHCWPYSTLVGTSAPAGLYVQLNWGSSTNTGANAGATSWSSCLPNIS